MKLEIKHRHSGVIIFSLECGSLKLAVEAAVKSRANLSWADLSWADLSGANLSWADLSWADLSGANLSWANLSGANLSGANLSWADLSKSALDPTNKPNAETDGFKDVPKQKGWVYGYRTRATSAAGRELQDDRIYGTEVFSVSDTECHPGWYLWPTLEASHKFSGKNLPKIKVKSRICDIHKAGSKWRSRAIWVIGELK